MSFDEKKKAKSNDLALIKDFLLQYCSIKNHEMQIELVLTYFVQISFIQSSFDMGWLFLRTSMPNQ